jgi:hypothetical protein
VGAPNILFTTASRTALGPTQPPIQWVPGALSLGVKQPVCEPDHSPPSSAEVKNEWSYTSTPQYTFIAWCSVKAQRQLLPLPLLFTTKGCPTHRHTALEVAGVHDQHRISSSCRHFVAELNSRPSRWKLTFRFSTLLSRYVITSNQVLLSSKGKVNLSLCLTKHYAMKAYWGVEV